MKSNARLNKQGNRGVHCRRHDDEMPLLKLQARKEARRRMLIFQLRVCSSFFCLSLAFHLIEHGMCLLSLFVFFMSIYVEISIPRKSC